MRHPLWRPFAPAANTGRQSARIGRRQTRPGPLQEHDPRWTSDYDRMRQLIVTAIPEQVLAIDHVGSTSVAGLVGKPVIDIDLTVPDLGAPDWLVGLESVGFRLIFADDLGGDPHRQLTFGEPNTNLHVWNPGAVEPQRHRLFVGWLQTHRADRDRYAAAKLAAAGTAGANYNDGKSAVVYEIYERAFLADPTHPHDPQPLADRPDHPA